MGKVIAIDGPSGSGKSTLSKLLAERLGFRFLDTGALYRAVALHLTGADLSPESSDSHIYSALDGVVVYFNNDRVFLNDRDVSDAIRTPEAGHYASVFSARKPVRDFLLQIQRDAAINNDIIAEGRDMTTIVFPDAWRKFYLDATEESRARRRYLQLREKGGSITMEEALKDVSDRDIRDSRRDIAPLKRAEDAIYVDTTHMTLEEVTDTILSFL